MRKVIIVLMLCIGCTVGIISCVYHKDDIEYPPDPAAVCDTANVRYSVEITAILQANCYSCHSTANGPSSGGGTILQGYNNLKIYSTIGVLYDNVNHSPGANPMPKGGAKLSDCDIAKIRIWAANGSPNN